MKPQNNEALLEANAKHCEQTQRLAKVIVEYVDSKIISIKPLTEIKEIENAST